ncbi:MAG: VacB/RNase II family 3'-5' exoribonuclease [Deltaproteobacteria bacterium]|nr:VacB/RNase II family 3'-5' exoribonuclease [Deltaproteobacteria bacterium]
MAVPSRADVLAYFEEHQDDVITLRELVDDLGVDSDDRHDLRDLLSALVEDGAIVRLKSKLYRAKAKDLGPKPEWTSPSKPAHGSPRRPRDDSKPKLSKGGLQLGIEPTQLVGVLQHMGGRAMAACSRPSGGRGPSATDELEYIPLEGDFAGLKKGDAAVFEIDQGRHRTATVAEVLGDPRQPRIEAMRIALARGFRTTFSEEAEAEARSFRTPELDDEHEDLRKMAFVTIDGEDAKDFDDAVYAEREGGGFRLWVAIADVSYYVSTGSALDRDGFHRGTSVYFPGQVLPMLPHALSSDLCSLRPKVDRLAFVSEMHVSSEGVVSDEKSYKAIICSAARLTYNQVEAALHKGEQNVAFEVGEPLRIFAECSRALRAQKARRGAIDLDLDEPQLVLGADGRPTGSVSRARLEAHRLIEDAMLAANSAIAREMHRRKLPAAYRVHEKPNADKLALVRMAAASFGYKHALPDVPSAAMIAKFVRALQNEERGPILLPLVLRSMARARYSDERLGHFALAEPDYLHFTSPIRRFPDLLVHKSLASNGKDAPVDLARATTWLSEREQSSERSEREVDDFYRCLLAEPLVGQEFPAVVTGVTDFGVFARVLDPYIEGLIGVRSLSDDYYALDELGLRLIGRRNGRSIGLGDQIKVEIKDVRPLRRQIGLEWVGGGEQRVRPTRDDRRPRDDRRAQQERRPSRDDRPPRHGEKREEKRQEPARGGSDFLARARERVARGEIGSKTSGGGGHGHGKKSAGGKKKFSKKRWK